MALVNFFQRRAPKEDELFKPISFCALLLMFAFVSVGCATPTPTPVPTATFTSVPTATLIPTATTIPPTATVTHTPTPLPPPTATRTPTPAPTPLLYRRLGTGWFFVFPAPPANGGCGTLAIENDLDLDVVAALVRYSGTATRPNVMAAVYVNAHRFYRILGLGSDNFLGEVYVATGEDWDYDLAKFTRKNQYLQSADRLMFFASPKCSNWTIKLALGAPDLQPIPENQFPSFR